MTPKCYYSKNSLQKINNVNSINKPKINSKFVIWEYQ